MRTAAASSLITHLAPVRREALHVNDGYAVEDDKLAAGVLDTLRGVWTLAEVCGDPSGAVAEYLDITGYSSDVTSQMD